MKIKGRKIFGFIFVETIISVFLFFLLFFSPELLPSLGPVVIGAMISGFVIMVGGNEASKYIKSRWFQSALVEGEEGE